MNIKDLNFVTPEIIPLKPKENINLSSPINFFKNVEDIPETNNNQTSSYDWKDDLTKYVVKDSGSKTRESYYNAKQYEKYHSALFNKPIFKDPSYYDNEELNAERQGFIGELFNGALKMHSSFLSSFVSTFNPVGYDNTVSNAMMDYSEKMENLFPNFYSKDERDNPLAFRNVISGNFIGDKLVKNIGFMTGAMAAALVQDAIVGTMTGGTALAPTMALQAGRAANWLQKAFKAETIAAKLVTTGALGEALTSTALQGTKALEYFNTMSKGQKILTQAKTTAFLANAAHGEAAIEALEGYRSIKEDLIKKHIEKFGEAPNSFEFEEIEKLATESANIRYGLNFATIFLADGIQFASLFKPLKAYTVGETLLEGIGRNADNLVLDATGKLVTKEFSKGDKIVKALTGELMRNNISEMFQEGLQYSFDKASTSYAQKKWNKDIRGGLSDYLYEQGQGLKAMVKDQEGQESMLLGFLTGYVAHGFKKGVQKIKGIDKQLEERQQYVIENFNQIDFNKLFDVKAFEDMVTRDAESFNGRTMQEIVLHQMREAISSKDILSFKSLQHELLFNSIRTSNALGKFDAFIEKLDTLKQLPDEDFKSLFGLDKSESNTVDEYVDKLKEESIELKKLIDQIDSTMPNPYEQNSLEWVAFNDMKDNMAFHLSFIKNIDSRLDSVTNKLLIDNPSLTEDIIYNLADSENFNQKFLQPLNEQRKQLFESYKLMSELKEGRDEKLYVQTRKELESIDRHIDLLNQHVKEYSEANKSELIEAEIGAFKNVVLEVLRFNHEKYTEQPFAYTQTQLEDTLNALIDFQKLKTSLGSVITESNKLQTPEGRAKFMEEHMKFLNRYSQNFMDSIKKVNFKNLKQYKEEHLQGVKNEISSNISEIEEINSQLQILNEQLIEAEDKEPIQKQIDELKAKKEELKKQNEELEKVADALENDKDLDENEKEEEDTIKAKLSNIERRRQEELTTLNVGDSYDVISSTGSYDGTWKIVEITDKFYRVTNEAGGKHNVLKARAEENLKRPDTVTETKYRKSNREEINTKYDAEYVEAVKKGEITKEQAKAALNQINRLTPELEKQIDNANIITVKKEENNSSEVSTIETVIPTTGITIDIQSQNKLDAPLEQLEKQDFNGRLHFKRTTDVEKTDGTGRTERFQSLLESFITNNGVSQTQNLNSWLENNKLKFVIMRPTDEMFNNKTFREEFKDANNELKSAVLVLVDENNKPIKIKDNKIDETGEFIVETLPTKQKKSTWSDQLQIVHDKEHKQLHDAVNKIKSSPDGVVIETKITAVTDGVYRFMVTGEFGKVSKVASPLTKSTLNSANSELFINTTGENLKVGNFTLQKGRLYLKIFNEDKTFFYFPISLGAISGSKTGDNIHSVLEYVFKNHKTLKEESETKLIAIQNYLNSVLYDGVDLNLPGDVKFRAYTNLLGDEPIFEINREKDGKKYTLQYSLATPTFSKKILFDFLKGVDINSITLSKTDEFTLPKVEKDSLSIEKINYADFILEQTQPTIPYKIDLSKGFDRVKQAVYFDIQEQNELLSNTPKSTEQEQITPEQVQSDIKAKKADIEKRRKEKLNTLLPKQRENLRLLKIAKKYGNTFGEIQDFLLKRGEKTWTTEDRAIFDLNEKLSYNTAKEDWNILINEIIEEEENKLNRYINSRTGNNDAAKINAEYDAELKALEQQPTSTTQSDIKDKKADIERRRQGLNGVEEIIFNNPNFRLEGFEIDGNYWNVVTSTDRAKVLVNINGVIVPFYLTTGQAGKGLVPGWYPFFGIGKDGWLNKTDKSDMETYYERYWGKETADIVKSISEELNSFYGTEPSTFKNDGDPNATSRPLSTLADKVEDYINSKLNYTPAINNADARKTLRSNVEQLGKEINAKYDAELAALEGRQTQLNIVKVYHHTSVAPQNFDFSNFQRGKNQISQFGDGLNAATTTNDFFVSRYGNPIEGEVKDSDFIVIDANKSEKELYEELRSKGYKFNNPATGSYIGNNPAIEYDSKEKANEQPAIISLFNDFQKSNPQVKGVKIINHIIGNQKVDPFYVIYDAKSFYGLGSLSKKSTQAPVSDKKADIERKKEELGLQRVLNIYPPDQSGGYRIKIKGDKYETLVQFTGKKWDIFPKQKNGDFQASDPETGDALLISKEQSRKLVEKYLPKKLVDLIEQAGSIKGVDNQIKFEQGEIKEYVDLFRKEWLQERIPIEEELLEFYQSDKFDREKEAKERIIKAQQEVIAKYDDELAALGEKETPNKFKTQDVIVKKDEKSNWNLTVNSDGTVLNKNTNKLLDKRLDKNLINKAHLKSGFLKYEKVIASNKKEYAVTEDGRVISLAKTSLGTELDVENSSIAKDALKKSTKFKVETPVVEEIKSENPKISTDNSTLVEEPTKEKKKFNKGNINIELKSAKRLPIIQSLGVTQTDIERVKSLFPHDVNIDNLFNVANSDAWATWSQSAITLFKGATRADLYHEAWHHFSQLYLTKDDKKRLYNETRDKVKELEGKSDLEVEEYIAREFAKFTETGKIEGKYPERKSIFEKIWNLLKSIFSNKTDLSLETLFNDLYKGQVNPLNYSTDNIMFGKLNSGINDNFSAIEADILNSGLDALVVQALQEFNISETQVYKLKDSNQLYEAIRNYIIDLYEQSENSIITSKLEKVLENWNDVKKAHLEYTAKKKGIKVNVEIDENNQLTFKEENEDEKKGRNSSDFSEASEKTIYDVMDTEVQSLIRNLVDKDEKGNEIIDPIFGLPRLVDFAKYVELLKDSFDDSQDFNQMVEKMNELSKKYPAIKDLVNRLFVNESPDVKLLRIKFVSSLGLVNKALVEAHITENGVIVARDASNSKKRQVEYDVASYFFKAPENNLISKVDGENVIASDKVSEIEKYNLLDINEQVRFLQDIGLDVSNLYKELNEKDKKQLFNPNSLIYLRDHIIKYLSTKGDIKNIVEVLQTPLVVKEGSKASKEVKVFKKLVELNQKYLAQYISGAFLNPEGKLEQSKVQWSTQDKVITKLRKAKKIQDLFSDPNFTHLKGFLDGSYLDMSSSKLLDYLFDKKTGERKLSSLTTDNYVGISSSDETKDGMKTKAMYSKDKMVSDINMFAQSNRLTTMQLSNKATHHSFQFNKPLVDSIDDFIDTMYLYLQDELNIIKSFDEGNRELTKLKKLPKSIKNAQGEYQFAIFKDIIKDQDAQSIIADFLKEGKLSNANTAKVRDAIKQFILEEKQATVEILGGFTNEIKTDVDRYRNASKELIIQDYIQNQFVFNVELSKLVYGNPYMHTDPYKRIAGASSAGRSILSDQTFLDYYNEMTTSTQRSKILDLLQSKVGGEYKLQTRKSDKEIRYFVAKDREVQSEYFKEILKAVDAELAKNPDNLELQEKRKAIENAYKEVNGSDAMGAGTIDFWRKSLFLSGRWDFHTLEPFYQKVINWDYYNRLMKSAENPQQELEYFTEREKYNISDEEMVNVAILKYQYYGTVENESIAEKAFHKFQIMPLIPQVIEGKNWSNHLDRMIYEDVDFMMFESASKLEQDKQVDNFYTKDNKTADFTSQVSNYQSGINSYNIKTGFLDNLKEQVFMENGSDDSILFGSQVRKLLFVTNDFSELYDEFRDTIQALTQIEKEKLMSLSGLDEQGRVTDNQKFVKFLLDEIDKKTVNKNVKEYLRLTNEGNFAHSLDTNIQRQPIESIINSVVNSRLVKQKMHGEMLVQVSNVGFESLEDGKGLKFYSLENGKVRKMQVKIPLTGKFKNLLNLVVDGKKVGTRERLNQLLKEGKIDTRSITMVGYRIPTQEHNSMEIMEVEEFLHPSFNGIVVPYELTAKAGSDFDIDKLNIFKPHIDENGYYVEKKFNSKSEAVDNYLQTKERINPLIKDIRIEKFNWQSNLVQETERVKKDIFERIQTLKNDLSFYKGQLQDNIVFNAMVYEKNQIINQMYQLFDDYRALRNKEDIGGEYEYRRGNPNYKYKDTLKFTVNKEVREYLNRTNSSFIKALFDEYTDISDETPIYDVKNEIVNKYNDRLSVLLNVSIALDAEFINNVDLKNKINELNGTKGYDSTGTFTGVSGEIQNLYSQLNSVFTNSKSAKIFIKGEMPEELKQIYERTMGYQFELSEELNKLYIDKNQAFLDMVNFKNSNQNKIIEIFDKVLLDPSNYLNLITPNSTFMFDGAMDNIFEALYPNDIQTKKGKKMPKDLNLTKSLLPRFSWQTKAILDEAGQALGIVAVGNTFIQLIQKANVEFTEDYLKKYKLLFKPESISKRTLSNGLSKATAYSQLINIYVDIVNDPRAGYLNMGDRVTPIINTMINMGLAIDTILYFINQPIIRDFVEYEGMVKNSLFKGKERINVYNEFLKYIGESGDYNFGSVEELSRMTGKLMKVNYSRFLKSDKKDYSDITNALLKEDVTHVFSNEEFKSSLGSTNSRNEKFAKEQLLLLTQYMQLSEISSDYRELQSSMNFDTTVAKDGFDSEQREKAFEEIIKKGIFTNLDVLKTKTVIAPLNISKELKNLNESLLPLVNSSTFYSFLSNKLESNFKNSTSKVKGRFVRTFKNDLISYIFQNFVTRSDVALTRFNETFSPVLGEFKNKPNEFGLSLLKNLYKEMIVLQENKPELANQYTILNNLFIVSEKQFKNIALSYFNKDSQLQDSYIEQFKELLNHKDLEVRNFMLKFAYMSFFQSGLNKSFISSADIIPAHVFAPILDAAREQYFKEVNTPQKQVNILKDAFDKFLANNDRFRDKEDNRGKSDFNTLGVKSDKGKWYESNIDEVLNPTLSVLDKQKVDLTNAIEFEGYYILDNKVYNNQGIEVYNPDVLQDFKLEKIKPTEEQQKVIDRVKEFIKSPNKELLSPENVLMISGAGGTGKTFSITRAARQLQKEKYVSIAFSAPTHNAKRELQKSLNDVYGKNRENAHTNASLFALDYNPITGKTTKRIINESFPPEYWNKSVIILDEYSMLGGELWKMIQERLVEKQEKGYGHTKIIFTGDYAQIPVPDSSRKEFMDGDVTNWIYHNRKDRVEGLYTNMRAKFADLANASARIRTYIDRINNSVIYKTTQEKPEEIIKDFNNSFIKNKETSTNVKYYNANNKVQWLDSYIDAYKNLSNRNPYFGVIVNYNNSAHINNINLTKKIREELFGLKSSNRFNEGELLIIDNNTLNAGLGTLGKDMRVYVESITKTKRKQNFSYKAKGIKGEKYFSIEFDAYQITATTDGEDVLTFYVPIINETVLDKYKNQDFDFLNIQGEKPENINQLIAIIDPNIAQVSYGYVVNSHKVQGSSYDQVWVQEDNILTAREPKEVLQLLYTAYSRPKYKTHSLNNNSNIEIKEEFEPYKKESESSIQQESPPQQSEVNTVEQSNNPAEQIYSQLGDKTQSENVVIDEVNGRKPVVESKELLVVEIKEIPKKEGESFEEMQRRSIQNLNIKKRIEIATKNNITQGKDYSFNDIKNLFKDKNLFDNDIYNQLEKVLSSNLTFKFGSLNTGKKIYNAYYDSNNNSIKIDVLALQTSDFKRILLHEIIHATTFINLGENVKLTNTQKVALNNLNNVIEELKKDREFFAQYGLTNANELLAELANDKFVDKLKNKKFDTNQNFFEKIISEIVKLLGLNTSAYDIVKESFDNLVSEYQQNQSSKPIVAYGTRGNNFLEAFEKDNAIGNPWSHLGSGQNENLTKKNLFTVKPIQSVDKKAVIKASIATQYIGFGEGISNSSTELYRQQVNEEYSKAVKEANSRPSTTNIPQNLQSGVEQYGTLQYANNEAQKVLGKNVTSIEMIENGFRTRTTRTDKELEKYDIKVGSYIKMFGKDQFGNTKNVIVKITKITKGYDDTTWYKEGWTEEGLQKLKDHTNSANAVEFQVIKPANSGNYSSNDVIFVSIGGKRGNEIVRKQQQDRTIKEALKAIEAGATLITDNKSYVESSDYNEGEKRLAKNLESKGYSYSEQTIDGQLLGVWTKNQYGLYKTNTVKEAVEEFIAWMIGEKHTDKLQDYRQAIIDRLPELKGKEILYYKNLGEPSHATALDYLINKYDWNKQQPNTVEQNVSSKGFQGYKGGFEDKGKGTPQGDGKDKAMREVADGFVVELSKNTPSSSLTSLKTGTILEQKGTKEQTSARSTKNLADEGNIIMLARNGSLSGKPLSQITKDMINYYHNDFNMEFVVGDMPNVDSQFIEYLQEIGAKFTIYHTGNTPRIQVKQSETKDVEQGKVIPLTTNFSRESVKKDTDYLYLFTDNTKRTSGKNSLDYNSWYSKKYTGSYPLNYPTMTQAVIRGLDNAFPVTTMVDDNRTQWKDSQFEEYKKIIDDEINTIKEVLSKYKGIKFGGEMQFGKGKISDMKNSAPKIWNYLNQKLAEIGIDNTSSKPQELKPKDTQITKEDTDKLPPCIGQ